MPAQSYKEINKFVLFQYESFSA